MSNKSYSEVATNLQLFIHPKSENHSDFLKTHKLCECVAKKTLESWPEEQFSRFKTELSEHAIKMTEALEDISVEKILSNGLPEQTQNLKELLENTIEYVKLCEKEVGVDVEF